MIDELENLRMQLAACGVVARANTTESAQTARQMLPQYRSASLEDVEAAVDREMELREALLLLEFEISTVIDAFTSETMQAWGKSNLADVDAAIARARILLHQGDNK
jgi:hypothetical protein